MADHPIATQTPGGFMAMQLPPEATAEGTKNGVNPELFDRKLEKVHMAAHVGAKLSTIEEPGIEGGR